MIYIVGAAILYASLAVIPVAFVVLDRIIFRHRAKVLVRETERFLQTVRVDRRSRR